MNYGRECMKYLECQIDTHNAVKELNGKNLYPYTQHV